MFTPGLTFTLISTDWDDYYDHPPLLHIRIEARNREFAAIGDIWRFQPDFLDYPPIGDVWRFEPSFRDYARALTEFSMSGGDNVVWLRSKTGTASRVELRPEIFDRFGHVALHVKVTGDNSALAQFVIECQVSWLNELGHRLLAWLQHPDETLEVPAPPT